MQRGVQCHELPDNIHIDRMLSNDHPLRERDPFFSKFFQGGAEAETSSAEETRRKS